MREAPEGQALRVCAVLWGRNCLPYCPFHPISLLLRKETGWSPKETRLGGGRNLITTVTPTSSTARAKRP